MKTKELQKLQSELSAKVEREYQDWWNHVTNWRTNVQTEVQRLKENVKTWEVYIDLVKENTDFERATFLMDDIEVDFVTDDWVIASRQVKNLKSAQKFDYIDTERREMRDKIIIDNCHYGIAVECMDMYDEDENQPMSALINPDVCIPDPKCTDWSDMRFFGFSRKVMAYKLENSDNYNLQGMNIVDSKEDANLQRSNQYRSEDWMVTSNDGFVDVYEHYTIYDGKKWLTTWINDRSVLIRAVELSPLTKAEEMNPMKCKFPIVFHRRKPYPYRWAGYRLFEEVGNEQDIVTILKNLELEQARISAHWPDLYVDAGLGIESAKLSKLKKWGRIIPVNPMPNGSSIQQHMYEKNYSGNTNLSSTMWQWVYDRTKRNTGYTDITMGVSPDGSQTKGEIQQLAVAANKFVSWISSNYLKWEKDYTFLWYRTYQENMPAKSKKVIALFDKWGMARTLRKEEFITDGKIIINVTSANQQKVINEKAVTKLLALSQTIIPALKSEYSVNTFLRTLVDKSGVEGIDGEVIIPKSYDENLALSRVEMINNNIEVTAKPEPWEDPQTHIDIYSKCIETPARTKILKEYNDVLIKKIEATPEMPTQTDWQGSNMAMNMMSQQSNPNTQPVTTM